MGSGNTRRPNLLSGEQQGVGIMKVIFDVGANWGSFSLEETKKNQNVVVFAFEPTPILVNHLRTSAKEKNIDDRYHIIDKAVSDYNGLAKFNIAGQRDWGCSSLLEFSDNLDKTWPGRTDFKVTDSIEVEVITLKNYIENLAPFPINEIDYFHCDTQGTDLKVLIGLGEHIHKIKAGVIEVASNNKVQLYKNQHTMKESKEFLNQHGFKITRQQSNDIHNNEYNIFFERTKI